MIIFLTFIVKLTTAEGTTVESENLAIVKDMATCQSLAGVLNEKVANDPDVAFICREVTPPTKA